MACVLKCIPILHYLAYNYKKKKNFKKYYKLNSLQITTYNKSLTIRKTKELLYVGILLHNTKAERNIENKHY